MINDAGVRLRLMTSSVVTGPRREGPVRSAKRPNSQSVSYFTVPPRAHPSTGSQSGQTHRNGRNAKTRRNWAPLLRAMVHSAPRAQTTAHLRRQRRARNRSSTSLRRTCTFRLEAAGNSFSKLNHARTESGPGAVPAGRPLVPLPASPVPANNVAEATGDTGPAGIARDGTSPVAPRPTRDRSKTERVCRSNTRPDVEDAGYRSLPQ